MGRYDNIIDESHFSSFVWIGKQRVVFLFFFNGPGDRVIAFRDFLSKNDLSRPFGTHHRNLSRRPRVIVVGTNMTAVHYTIGSPVGFPGDYCHPRNGSFAAGIEEFGPSGYDPTPFLLGPWKKARNVFPYQYRDIETITKPDESSPFGRGIHVEDTGQISWLIGHDSNTHTRQSGETSNKTRAKIRLAFEKTIRVDQLRNHCVHIVGSIGIFRNDPIQIRTVLVPGYVRQIADPFLLLLWKRG